MNRTTILALALLLSPLTAAAENLMDIYNLAKSNDPAYRGAEAAWHAALEAKPQSRALLFPSVNVSANRTENDQTINQPVASAGKSSFSSDGYTLSLTQPVYHHDYFVGLKQADAQVGQANANYRADQQDLMLRSAERYFAVLSAQDNLEFARAEKKAVARQLEQTQKRFEVGLIAITDVHEARAQFDLTIAREIEAENALSNSREELAEITGQNHEHFSVLASSLPLINPEPADIDQWTTTAEAQNLRLIAAQRAAEIAKHEISRQRAGHLPTLDLVGNSTNTYSGGGRFGESDIDNDSISLQFSINLFQGGAVSSKVREAEHLRTQANENRELQRRAVLRSTRQAYNGVLAAISRVKALKQALVSSESALEATEAGFEVGTRTIVDVLVALRGKFAAKRDYSQARYDYILGTLSLKQAAGMVDVSDLEKINNWLQ